MVFKFLIIAVAALAGFFLVRPAAAFTSKSEESNEDVNFESLLKRKAEEYKLPWEILSGIAFAESNYDPKAVRVGPGDNSVGLMQILCNPDGRGGCANRFPAINGWVGIKRESLFNVEKNVDIAAQILRWNVANFGLLRGVAIYNSFNQRFKPFDGPFDNQSYVNKVITKARELGYEF